MDGRLRTTCTDLVSEMSPVRTRPGAPRPGRGGEWAAGQGQLHRAASLLVTLRATVSVNVGEPGRGPRVAEPACRAAAVFTVLAERLGGFPDPLASTWMHLSAEQRRRVLLIGCRHAQCCCRV